MKFGFLKKTSNVVAIKKSVAKKTAVKNATKSALIRYEKTFKDLAKYDRGERLSISLPR